MNKKILTTLMVLGATTVCADGVIKTPTAANNLPENRVYIGPEFLWDHTNVKVHFGSAHSKYKDDGFLVGGRIGFDHVQPDAFYIGTHFLYAAGKEKTHFRASHKHNAVRGHQSAHRIFENIEGRIGYNFTGGPYLGRTYLTPFIGAGGFYNKAGNWRHQWAYAAAGLRTNFAFRADADIGTNLKVLYSFNDQWGYEISLPITWNYERLKKADFQLEPYILKLNSNLPSQMFGVRLLIGYHF